MTKVIQHFFSKGMRNDLSVERTELNIINTRTIRLDWTLVVCKATSILFLFHESHVSYDNHTYARTFEISVQQRIKSV